MNKEEKVKNVSSFFNWQDITTALSVIFLAFLLWLFVKSEDEYSINYDIPIEIRNLPSSFILNEEVPKTAKIQIKGQGRSLFKTLLLKRFFPEFKLLLDLERISEKYSFVLNDYFDQYPQKVVIPPSFDISFVEVVHPSSIYISLDEYKEKEVYIKTNIYVKPKLGYVSVGNPEINPEFITITGSRNTVENIEHVVINPDSILGVDENINISFPLNPPPGQVLEYSHKKITYSQAIQKIDERIISEIPVKVLNQDSTMRVFVSPQTVSLTVVGGNEFISNLKPSEIEASVDFKNWSEGMQFYEIKVNAPKDVIDWMDLSPMSIELIATQINN